MVTKATWQRYGPPIAVAIVAFSAARLALLPGVDFWDTGELQTVGPVMGTAHPTGFPTYVLLGWLASVVLQPFGDPALRMNILSALCLAAAAGLTVDLVRALTRSTVLGAASGVGLALTPIAWAIGTHAETHALHLLLVVVLVRLLVAWESAVGEGGLRTPSDRYLVSATVVLGLAVGNHSLTLLLAPAVGLFVLAVDPPIWRRRRLVLTCVATLAVTVALVYLELPLRAGPFRASLVYGRPDTWNGFWYVALGQQFQGSLVDPFGDLPGKVGELVNRTVDQFGLLAPLIPVAYVTTAVRRPRFALLTGTATVITCFFAASYENADIGRYYLGPILFAWTWLAILAELAAGQLARVLDERALVEETGRRARGTLAGVVALALLAPTAQAVPAVYARVDVSDDHLAAEWTDLALAVMEPGAVVVSWWSYSTPLWYAQRVEGRRPDLIIVDDRTRLDEGLGDITDVIDANLGVRPVYVIRADPDEVIRLITRYELEPVDGAIGFHLTRVVGRRRSGS